MKHPVVSAFLFLTLAASAAAQKPAVPLAPLIPNQEFFGVRVPTGYVGQPLVAQVAAGASVFDLATGRGVTVALIDNGVDPFSPVLSGSLLSASGWNFYNNSPNWSAWSGVAASLLQSPDHACPSITPASTVSDAVLNGSVALVPSSQDNAAAALALIAKILRCDPTFGHGTAVAGRIHLIAPEAKILPITAFGPRGATSASAIANSIFYAIAHHASIINLSFSANSLNPEIQAAIAAAVRHGIVVVAAAGNQGMSAAVYPASLPDVIGVGAMDGSQRARFSDFDPPAGILDADVAAPGVGVLTTFPGFGLVWASVSGTSFSVAIVAGEAALLVQAGQSAAQIADDIEASADPALPGDADGGLGHGLVQVLGALKLAGK